MRYFNTSQPTVSLFGETKCFQCFSVTPSSLLLIGEGIKDVLRSFMAGFRHPPTVLTELDSCA